MSAARVACLATVALAAAAAACSKPYTYRFELTDPGAVPAAAAGGRDTFEDDSLKAEIQIAGGAIGLELTNKTDDLLQVEWNKISVARGDGQTTMPRPTVDLGWIRPGQRAAAQLVPLVFPRTGADAAAYEGRHLELDVPVILRREPKTYRFHFVAHVRQP
jgi:hypothetical protein